MEEGDSHTIIMLLLVQVALIALNAVFACAEIAVISMNDAKLSRMAADGDKRAIRLVNLTDQPAKFLATIQVAITLSGFLGSALAADNFSEPLTKWIYQDLGFTVLPSQTNFVFAKTGKMDGGDCDRGAGADVVLAGENHHFQGC